MGGDLQKQFGRPASALAGMLPPRATPAPRVASEQDSEAEESQPTPVSPKEEAELAPAPPNSSATAPVSRKRTGNDAAPAARPARPRSSAGRELRQAPAALERTQTHQTVVYVSAATKAAAEQRRKQTRSTNAALVLDALDEVLETLPELLAARQVTPRSEDSLFPSRRVPQRASSPSTRKVTFTFQATAVELQIIQDLVREFGASSLSELVAVAMESHLLLSRSRRS